MVLVILILMVLWWIGCMRVMGVAMQAKAVICRRCCSICQQPIRMHWPSHTWLHAEHPLPYHRPLLAVAEAASEPYVIIEGELIRVTAGLDCQPFKHS